jgi:hypothetical protein
MMARSMNKTRSSTQVIPSRRSFLMLGAGITGAALIAASARADDATPGVVSPGGAPLSKAAVGYQDVPNGSQVCGNCIYFAFYPTTGSGPGSRCKLVAGPINPAGWCEVWGAK